MRVLKFRVWGGYQQPEAAAGADFWTESQSTGPQRLYPLKTLRVGGPRRGSSSLDLDPQQASKGEPPPQPWRKKERDRERGKQDRYTSRFLRHGQGTARKYKHEAAAKKDLQIRTRPLQESRHPSLVGSAGFARFCISSWPSLHWTAVACWCWVQ